MINITTDHNGVETKIVGEPATIIAETIVTNVAITKAISEIKGVSYENAALYIMQDSIRVHSDMKEIEE